MIWFATYSGIGVSPDTITYLNAAENWLLGNGISVNIGAINVVPLTHFPPLFVVFLGFLKYFGGDPLIGIRWFSSILMAINAVLLVRLIQKDKNINRFWSLIITIAFVSSETMFQIHSEALTESLFLFFCLLGSDFIIQYLNSNRQKDLLIAALIFSLASLTRYIGVFLIVVSFIIFLWRKIKYPSKMSWGILIQFIVCSTLPLSLWGLRNYLLTNNLAGRSLGIHFPTWQHIKIAISTISTWMIPSFVPLIIRILLILISILLIAFSLYRKIPHLLQNNPVFQYSLLYQFVYMFLLIGAMTFFDAATPLDHRLLSPLFPFFLISLVNILDFLLREKNVRLNYILYTSGCIVILLFAVQGFLQTTDGYRNGVGYITRAWMQSELANAVRELPETAIIYSNKHEQLQVLLLRNIMEMPRLVYDTRENENYNLEINNMFQVLNNNGGYLALFTNISNEEKLTDNMPFILRAADSSQTIYFQDGVLINFNVSKILK